MKLFYSPNACSIGIHVLLEEIGKPYDTKRLNFAEREQHGNAFIAINPKRKVPVLQLDDGKYLTEFPAIAFYLARANPEKKLLPTDLEGEAHALEIMDYMISVVHMRGFTRIFRPENFWPVPEEKEKIQQAGRDIVLQGFELLEPEMAGKNYILGDLSIVDGALFFLENWAVNRAKLNIPAPFAAHLQRMMDRPAVKRVMADEGLA